MKNEKYEISKEALWAISNATSGGSPPQLAFLVNQGVIPPLCSFLKNVNNKKILMVALEGIENILRAGQKASDGGANGGGRNNFAEYVEECGGVDYLEQLQSNQSIPDEIFEKAAGIIKQYFDGAEEADNMFDTNGSNRVQGDTNEQQQQAQNGAQFAFGTGNAPQNQNPNQQGQGQSGQSGQQGQGQNFSF